MTENTIRLKVRAKNTVGLGKPTQTVRSSCTSASFEGIEEAAIGEVVVGD